MAFRVEITPDAEFDASDILDWLLSQDAGETGLRWFLRLEEAIASLASFPARCGVAPENDSASRETRQLLYGRLPHTDRILFTIKGGVVCVLRIRHGRRRSPGHLH